jgi:hypothetical protein
MHYYSRRDSSVGITTRLQAERSRNRGSIRGKDKTCSSSPQHPDQLQVPQCLLYSGYREPFRRGKAAATWSGSLNLYVWGYKCVDLYFYSPSIIMAEYLRKLRHNLFPNTCKITYIRECCGSEKADLSLPFISSIIIYVFIYLFKLQVGFYPVAVVQ